MTFAMVEERMVEAMVLWRRSPDRERGWHRMRAFWPDIVRHNWFGDYADTEAEPRPLPLTRAEVAERDEASEWMRFVPERDRRLVVMALMCLARGEARVPWRRLLQPLGLRMGADGLRMRYARAIEKVANALNGGNPGGIVSNRKSTCGDDFVCSAPGVKGAIPR
ncbi:MAG: hypothetical protein ACK4K7_03100 [Allosphingosinicella sp.]|uniref:hypothetical protein n=1 Tax=Allosphingosinicella sp. TaxID=2823234 RepID=UPI003923CCE6